MNFADERTYSSSFQWTAICASFVSAERSVDIVPKSPRLRLSFFAAAGRSAVYARCVSAFNREREDQRQSFSEHEARRVDSLLFMS